MESKSSVKAYTDSEDYVVKRNGKKEKMSFDKILKRLKNLGQNNLKVNYTNLVQKIIDRLYNNIATTVIDELTAQQCASLCTTHPDYQTLAARILVSNHHKNTSSSFKAVIKSLYKFKDVHGKHTPIVSKQIFDLSIKYSKEIVEAIDYDRDFLIDYFGFKTLERAYLMKVNGSIVERPQHMWMRVSIGIHGDNIKKIIETYNLMSLKYFTHATPTLFNAGTNRPQLSSCYLLAMENDSIKGIYNTLGDCAAISKWAGGIGLHIHNVRASGSHIRGTNGTSNGIVPMLRVFNNTARYVDQGGGKRNGSFAIYLAPWHGDIFEFLEMKKNHGDEEARARDLFYALWVPDLFIERVKNNNKWSLMCPDVCKGLSDVYGDDFKNLYENYENEGKFIKQVQARDLWFKILDSQIETGTPYILYSDAANKKSNQKNLGTIKSSNLCCEIIEYSNDKETAVCNLASVNLSSFVSKSKFKFENKSLNIYTKNDCVYCKLTKNLLKEHNIDYNEIRMEKETFKKYFYETYEKDVGTYPQIECDNNYIGTFDDLSAILCPTYDFDELHSVVKVITENLNKVIDVNFYPTQKTLRSNLLHRPIGIGIQGLANCFALMNIPFHSNEAKELNKLIFETIYHAALEKSNELAFKRKDNLVALYHSWQNKEWSFTCESNPQADEPHCRTYNTSLENIQKILDEVKPIYAEMKNFKSLSSIGSYSSFKGSPISNGTMQFDFWEVNPTKYNFKILKESIIENGIRNSLLVAPMPTASTSQILGNNECFEPFTSNIYLRRTIAGEFVVINKHLIQELLNIDLWNEDVKNQIIANDGSIQNIKGIPSFIKEKYKTVWEIPMKHILDMSADRGAFICQSQSNNLWMKEPNYKKLTAMHFYSHKLGLKTGIYYLRTQAKSAPQQFTIDPTKNKNVEHNSNEPCEMCSA